MDQEITYQGDSSHVFSSAYYFYIFLNLLLFVSENQTMLGTF